MKKKSLVLLNIYCIVEVVIFIMTAITAFAANIEVISWFYPIILNVVLALLLICIYSQGKKIC